MNTLAYVYQTKQQCSVEQEISHVTRETLTSLKLFNSSGYYFSISIYFVQNQVGLQSQNTNEQNNQAHNMLSQLPAVKDRKVKQQYN